MSCNNLSKKLKITGEYTFMQYLAQQPGGLTDAQFEAYLVAQQCVKQREGVHQQPLQQKSVRV